MFRLMFFKLYTLAPTMAMAFESAVAAGTACRAPQIFFQHWREGRGLIFLDTVAVNAGIRLLDFSDLLGRAFRDDLTAGAAAFRTQVDDMVGALRRFHIMFDDDDRMTLVDQLVESPGSRSMS